MCEVLALWDELMPKFNWTSVLRLKVLASEARDRGLEVTSAHHRDGISIMIHDRVLHTTRAVCGRINLP